MIEVEMNFGDEEYGILTDLLIDTPQGVRSRKIWRIVFVLAGLYLLGYGIYGLVTAIGWFHVVCLCLAAAAFFMAFGGERALLHRSILRKTRAANAKLNVQHRKYTFDENGVSIESSLGNGRYDWDAMTAWGELSHYLWIQRKDGQYILADTAKMSPEDGERLRQYCTGKIHA